jgi:hypothetical protein
MIGVGHPDRSFVDWLMPKGHRRYGLEPDVPPPPEPIAFDVYGNWHEHRPEQTRVTPAKAREAAREYVATGGQPRSLQWRSP